MAHVTQSHASEAALHKVPAEFHSPVYQVEGLLLNCLIAQTIQPGRG